MNGTFKMDMPELHRLGVKVSDLSAQFGDAHKKLNKIVEELVTSAYTSSDAVAIANAIRSYEPLLNNIQIRLDNFGAYGQTSSQITDNVNSEIKQNIAGNLNNG